MANICSYVFKWDNKQGRLFNDPDSYDQEVSEGITMGSRKWSPPISLLREMEVSGRLDWEEHGLLGLGYTVFKNGLITEQVQVDTPQTVEDCKEVMRTYPTLDVQNLIDQYEEEGY